MAGLGWQAASAQPLVGVPTALLSPLPPARGTPRTRPSSGAQGGTFSAFLGSPRLHARHRDQGGGLGGPDEAHAARLGAARRPSLAGAAHHAQACAEEPVAPVAHELVACIDRAVQLSHALPTIKFETTNIRPQKRPARAARAGERLASQLASFLEMAESVIKLIESDVKQILWSTEPTLRTNEEGTEKKSRRHIHERASYLPIKKGGGGIMHWESHCQAFYAQWMIRYLHPRKAPWKETADRWICEGTLGRGAKGQDRKRPPT